MSDDLQEGDFVALHDEFKKNMFDKFPLLPSAMTSAEEAGSLCPPDELERLKKVELMRYNTKWKKAYFPNLILQLDYLAERYKITKELIKHKAKKFEGGMSDALEGSKIERQGL